MRSFVFFNGLFYKVLFSSLLLSVAVKAIINYRIDPKVLIQDGVDAGFIAVVEADVLRELKAYRNQATHSDIARLEMTRQTT